MEAQLVNARTKIYAILGDPISHSMSPVIMNASFRRFGMDCVFLALKCGKKDADCVMKALRCVDLAGYVFTMPMKEAVGEYLDEWKDEALLTGAVNCVLNKDGYLTGYNTDSMGFWTAVREKCDPKRTIRKVFVMVCCPQVNVQILDWNVRSWEAALSDADVVVNATSNGLNGKGDLREIFPYEAAAEQAIFFDAIYSPLKTDYLSEA